MGSAHPRFSRLPVKLSAAQHLVFRNSSVASGSLRMTQNDLVLSCCLSFIGRPRAADTADPLRPSVTSALIRVDFQVEQPLNLTSLALVTGRSSELPRYTKPPSTGLFYVGADPRVRPMLGAHMGAPLQKILRLLMVAWELSGGSWLSLLRVNGLRRRAAPGPEKPGGRERLPGRGPAADTPGRAVPGPGPIGAIPRRGGGCKWPGRCAG